MVEKNKQTASKKRTVMPILLKKVLGFLIFITILLIGNYLRIYIGNPLYVEALAFFNANIILFVTIFFVDAIQKIFWNFRFPFNLPAPILSSVLGILDLILFYNFWIFFSQYIQISQDPQMFSSPSFILIGIILVLVILVVGYSKIIINLVVNKQFKSKVKKNMKKLKKYNFIIYIKTWKEVGKQFKNFFHKVIEYSKELLYNIGEGLQTISSGSKRTKKRK